MNSDIIKRLRETGPRLASMGVVLSELAKHMASVIPTPRDAETVTRAAALLEEAATELERGVWKPPGGYVLVPKEPTLAMVNRGLNGRVPGGSEVMAWLPMSDPWTPHENARDVLRCAYRAMILSLQDEKT